MRISLWELLFFCYVCGQFLASAPLPAFQGDAKFTYWVR